MPADKRMPNARQPVDFKAVGVTDTTLGSIDLGKEERKLLAASCDSASSSSNRAA